MKVFKNMAISFLLILTMAVCGCGTASAVPSEAQISEEVLDNMEREASEEAVKTAETDASGKDALTADSEAASQEPWHGEIISITMAEMEEKMQNKESFLVSFVTTDCPYCHDFHDLLEDYVQDNSVIMYQVILDYEERPEEENRRLVTQRFEEFNTVPGVFYVQDGVNASYLDFYNLGISYDVFDSWVRMLGLVT